MVSAAQMLVGVNQPSGTNATGASGAGASSNALQRGFALNMPDTATALGGQPNTQSSAMESFAAALRASVSAMPLSETAARAPNTGPNTGEGATPLADALAGLTGQASTQALTQPHAMGSNAENTEVADQLLAALSENFTAETLEGMAEGLSGLGGLISADAAGPSGFAGRVSALAGTPGLITQEQLESLGLGSQLALGLDPNLGQNLGQNLNPDADHPATPVLSALMAQISSADVELPAGAQTVLDNGGTFLEFRQAILDANLPQGELDALKGSFIAANGEVPSIEKFAAGLFGKTIGMSIADPASPDVNAPHALGAPESGSDAAAATIDANSAHTPTSILSRGTATDSASPEALMAAAAASTNSQVSQTAGNAQNASTERANTTIAAPASAPLAAERAASTSGSTPASIPANAGGTSNPAGAITPEAATTNASNPAAAPAQVALQKSSLGELVQQVRSGEVSPEHAREALTASGRGHLAERLPLAQITTSAASGKLAAGATATPTADVSTPSTIARPSVEPIAVADGKQIDPGTPIAMSERTANSLSGPVAQELAATKNSALNAAGREGVAANLSTTAEGKSSVAAAFAKAQSPEAVSERPLQAGAAQPTLGMVAAGAAAGGSNTSPNAGTKKTDIQFTKSAFNAATAPSAALNNAALPSVPAQEAANAQQALPNTSLNADMEIARQAARPATEMSAEARIADRPATTSAPTPSAAPQTSEAIQSLDRPEAIRDRGTEVRSVMRFDQATRVAAVQDMSVALTRFAAQGLSRFQIRLDPAELGRVDVKLEMSADGRATAHIAADRPETLDMLRNDSRTLERALQDAGLKTDQNSMNFSLKDQSEHARQGTDRDGLPEWAQGGDEEEALTQETTHLGGALEENVSGLRIMGMRGIDVRI